MNEKNRGTKKIQMNAKKKKYCKNTDIRKKI